MTEEPHISLEEWIAWLKAFAGMGDCTGCRWKWKGLGRVDGMSTGKGWVRMSTDPDCPEHGRRRG